MTSIFSKKKHQAAALVVAAALMLLVGRGSASDGERLSVMTYNMGNFGHHVPNTEEVTAVIQAAGVPDVLLVQDVPWQIKFDDLAQILGYPHFVSARKLKPASNLAILSRWPLSRVEQLVFPSNRQKSGAMCALARVGGQEARVCTVHLPSLSWMLRRDGSRRNALGILFGELFRETPRSQDVDDLIEWLNIHPVALTIVGGDFNTFFPSRGIRAMDRVYDDALWPSLDFFVGTYRKIRFPLKPRIDFLFHSKNIQVGEAEVIRHTAGDHYPVRAVFVLPK